MTALDRWLQRYRMRIALRWIPPQCRLLDIGCHQGELFAAVGSRIESGVGIDPLAKPRISGNFRIIQGEFPAQAIDESFDAITVLAVLEHVADLGPFVAACVRHLAPRGRLIITVPSPVVDRILAALVRLRLIHGMSLEEHHGYRPSSTVATFENEGLECLCARRFQLGLNHLFVLERPLLAPCVDSPAPIESFWRRCLAP